MTTSNEKVWSGSLRLVHILTVAILLFSICGIVLGAEYVKQVTTQQNNIPKGYNPKYGPIHYWPGGSIFVGRPIFYSSTLPFLSIAHSALNLTIPHFTTLSPIYLVLTSFVFVLGWLAQWGFWMDCEITPVAVQHRRPYCPQGTPAATRRYNFLSGIPPSEVNLRVTFGGVVLALYLVLFMWSIAGQLRKNRLTRKSRRGNATSEIELEERGHA